MAISESGDLYNPGVSRKLKIGLAIGALVWVVALVLFVVGYIYVKGPLTEKIQKSQSGNDARF